MTILAWAFQFMHICHHSKRKLLYILKLDFEKAFDKMEHQVILLICLDIHVLINVVTALTL